MITTAEGEWSITLIVAEPSVAAAQPFGLRWCSSVSATTLGLYFRTAPLPAEEGCRSYSGFGAMGMLFGSATLKPLDMLSLAMISLTAS